MCSFNSSNLFVISFNSSLAWLVSLRAWFTSFLAWVSCSSLVRSSAWVASNSTRRLSIWCFAVPRSICSRWTSLLLRWTSLLSRCTSLLSLDSSFSNFVSASLYSFFTRAFSDDNRSTSASFRWRVSVTFFRSNRDSAFIFWRSSFVARSSFAAWLCFRLNSFLSSIVNDSSQDNCNIWFLVSASSLVVSASSFNVSSSRLDNSSCTTRISSTFSLTRSSSALEQRRSNDVLDNSCCNKDFSSSWVIVISWTIFSSISLLFCSVARSISRIFSLPLELLSGAYICICIGGYPKGMGIQAGGGGGLSYSFCKEASSITRRFRSVCNSYSSFFISVLWAGTLFDDWTLAWSSCEDTCWRSLISVSVFDLSLSISQQAASLSDCSLLLVAIKVEISRDNLWHSSFSIDISFIFAANSSDNCTLVAVWLDVSRKWSISSCSWCNWDACTSFIFSFSMSIASTSSWYDLSVISTTFRIDSNSAMTNTRSILSWSRSASSSLTRRINCSTSFVWSTLLALKISNSLFRCSTSYALPPWLILHNDASSEEMIFWKELWLWWLSRICDKAVSVSCSPDANSSKSVCSNPCPDLDVDVPAPLSVPL